MKFRFIFYSFVVLSLFGIGHFLRPELSWEFVNAWELWRDPIAAGMVSGLTLSLLGIYILLNRIVFVSLGVAQGAGLGIFTLFWTCGLIGYHLDHSVLPFLSGLLFASLFTLIFVRLRGHPRFSEESVIGLLYIISSGLILIIGDRIPQGRHDLDNLLFGSAVAVSLQDLIVLLSICFFILLLHFLYRREFLFISADSAFMKSRGANTSFWTALLFFLLAAGITVSLKTLGALPVFALMLISAFIGLKRARSIKNAFLVTLLLGTALPALGYYFSYLFSLPTGAAGILVGVIFLGVSVVEKGFSFKKSVQP